MGTHYSAPGWLGAAFLIVIVLSAASGSVLLAKRICSARAAGNLRTLAEISTLMRINIIDEMAAGRGIIALALLIFYCTGGLMWYSLLFSSRYVPRALSLFGILAAGVRSQPEVRPWQVKKLPVHPPGESDTPKPPEDRRRRCGP
jgi:hypothetical protein